MGTSWRVKVYQLGDDDDQWEERATGEVYCEYSKVRVPFSQKQGKFNSLVFKNSNCNLRVSSTKSSLKFSVAKRRSILGR